MHGRTSIGFISALLVSALFQPLLGRDAADTRLETVREVRESFASPPMGYRSVPFWSWNDKMTREEIDLQLEDFKARGIGGVFMHPRYGLVTEYLSDEWFELVRHTADKCRELGMEAWIYDENSYPSGFAGGHVPAQMPESYNQGQGLKMKRIARLDPEEAGEAFLVLAGDGQGKYEVLDGASIASSRDREGEYLLFEKACYDSSKWYGGYSYVDLMVEGVAEKFIEVTMTGYERVGAGDFGGVIPGVFTDEPNISTPQSGETVRWTPDLFTVFREKWGYSLEPCLPSLFEETGDWKKVRHDYQSVLLDLFIDRWSKPWWEYTEKHNLEWTGHYWEHGWPSPGQGPDNMAMYAWHQVPAIDLLFNRFERKVQFGNVRNVKELSSVANQLGRHRTLSETYGGGGWELRFEDMKRLGDWEYVLGVNFLNQHLSHVSLKGDRKHDYPQSFTYHNPWWEYYRPLADYYARLSLALSSGYQVNPVLVLEPTTTAWMYAAPGNDSEKMELIKQSFTELTDTLERMQCEYDLGCENIIRDHGRVSGARFSVGERNYRVVIIPPCTDNLDRGTLDLLTRYLDNGGMVILLGEVPRLVDGAPSPEMAEWKSRYRDNLVSASSVKEAGGLILPADFSLQAVSGGDLLYHHRRNLEDGQLVFLVNSSLDETASGELVLEGRSLAEMDLFQGSMAPFAFSPAGKPGFIRASFELPPAGSLLLCATGREGEGGAVPLQGEGRVLASEGEMEIVPGQSNMLVLDYCDLELKGEKTAGIYYHKGTDMIYQAHGFQDNPWNRSVQYKTEILDKGDFAAGTGFKADFHFQVESGTDISDLRAVVEQPRIFEVRVNGERVAPVEGEWWLDRDFGVYRIGSLVTPGSNTITLSVSPMHIMAELEPVYLLGGFSLESMDRGWKLVPAGKVGPGSWKAQGMPFYSGKVSYGKTYSLEEDPSGRRVLVRLRAWKGTVAEVRVNGRSAGIIGWQPYELEIGELLGKGENRVEVVVVGSLKNLLGPLHTPWQRGIVTIGDFQQGPETQPKGTDYDTLDYGLMDDFELVIF